MDEENKKLMARCEALRAAIQKKPDSPEKEQFMAELTSIEDNLKQ